MISSVCRISVKSDSSGCVLFYCDSRRVHLFFFLFPFTCARASIQVNDIISLNNDVIRVRIPCTLRITLYTMPLITNQPTKPFLLFAPLHFLLLFSSLSLFQPIPVVPFILESHFRFLHSIVHNDVDRARTYILKLFPMQFKTFYLNKFIKQFFFLYCTSFGEYSVYILPFYHVNKYE